MEKTWRGCGPFNKSPFIELLQLLQIYIIWRVFTFFFFDILKFTIGFPTNCWQILNWPISINFHPLFQFYYLQCVILGWQQPFLLQWESDVRESFFFFFWVEAQSCFDQIMWWLFLPDCESLRPFYNLPKDFQAVRNSAHWVFVCWQITAVVEIELLTSILALTFGFE